MTDEPNFVIPDDVLRRAIQEALDDPRPSIPAEEVFARIEARYREDQLREKQFDDRIADDARAGRLDRLAAEALADVQTGNIRDL